MPLSSIEIIKEQSGHLAKDVGNRAGQIEAC